MRSTRIIPVLVLALAGLGLYAARERRAAAAPSSDSAQPGPARPDAAHLPARTAEDAQSPAPTPAAPRAKVALLVGVDTLAAGSRLPELGGCVADVRAARALLLERFGFAEADVLVLENAEATHERIVRAWREWLVPRAGPATEAVFWFAGHGSQTPDASGRDSSRAGFDQTLIAYDSRADGRDGEYDLGDDELYVLTRELTRRGAHLFAVTDACHSATNLRGVPEPLAPRIRGVDAGTRALDRARIAAFWQDLDWIDDGDPRRADDPLLVHVAACGSGQNAYETSVPDAEGRVQSFGVLSYCLLQALRAARPDQSCAELVQRAADGVRATTLRQDLVLEGPAQRALFGGAFAGGARGFPSRVEGGTLRIEAGLVCGLVPASELAVEDATGRTLGGPATIERAGALSSIARWTPPPTLAARTPLFARERKRGCATRRLELASTIPRWLEGRSAAARARLEGLASLGPPRAGAELVLQEEDGRGPCLRDAQGVLVWRAAAAHALDAQREEGELLADELVRELEHRALLALPAGGTVPVQARFCEPTAEDWLERVDERFQTRPRIEARIARAPELAGEVYRARAGEEEETALVVLELANTLGRELWVNVLSVCEDRTHQLVTEGGTPILLGAQATRRVTIRLAHPAALELRRPLLDRYLVLASSRRYSLRDLERRDVPRGAGPDDEPGLPAIFEVAQHETITRGAAHAAVPIDPEDYGLRVLDVLVERAP